MVQFGLLQALWIVIISMTGGWQGIVFLLLQATVAVFMLETVAYIEHYGLLRARQTGGKYDPMSPINSWDFYGFFRTTSSFNCRDMQTTIRFRPDHFHCCVTRYSLRNCQRGIHR